MPNAKKKKEKEQFQLKNQMHAQREKHKTLESTRKRKTTIQIQNRNACTETNHGTLEIHKMRNRDKTSRIPRARTRAYNNVMHFSAEYLRRGVVVVGAEGVDGEDDLGNGARRVGCVGWRLERASYERRAFHEPHCSLRFLRVQVPTAIIGVVHGVPERVRLEMVRKKKDKERRALKRKRNINGFSRFCFSDSVSSNRPN
jgi:hypothetical protein